MCYGGPSFYARGATGQQPTATVAPHIAEPLPLARLPAPPCAETDALAVGFAQAELQRHTAQDSWDVADCLRLAVAACGARPEAVQDGQVSWSYGQLAAAAAGLRDALLGLGVAEGDCVGLMLPNSAVHLAAHYGITAVHLRAVALNLSPRLQPPELLRRVTRLSEPRVEASGRCRPQRLDLPRGLGALDPEDAEPL